MDENNWIALINIPRIAIRLYVDRTPQLDLLYYQDDLVRLELYTYKSEGRLSIVSKQGFD